MQNCYNRRIPREELNDTDERLTQKHIHTLQFVKEIAEENKQLKSRIEELENGGKNCAEIHALAESSKERIQQMQDEHNRKIDEIVENLTKKHKEEILTLVDERLSKEKFFTDEITTLNKTIVELEKTNRELFAKASALAESEDQIHDLQTKLDNERSTNRDLQSEIDRLKNDNQLSSAEQLDSLKNKNELLSQELKEINQKNLELKFRISKLEKELKEASGDQDLAELIDSLRKKVSQMQKERNTFTEKESGNEQLIQDLRNEIEALKEEIRKLQAHKVKLAEEFRKVYAELQDLKSKYASDSAKKSFQDFVSLKREFAVLKEENETLKQALKLNSSNNKVGLPPLKVKSEGSYFGATGSKESVAISSSKPAKSKQPLKSISYLK